MAPDPRDRAILNQALFDFYSPVPLGPLRAKERFAEASGEEEGGRRLQAVYRFRDETTALLAGVVRVGNPLEVADRLVDAIRLHYPELTEDTLNVLRNSYAYSLGK